MNRFISPDPIGLRAGDPNFYRYVFGDPINYHDPLGLWRIGDPLPQGVVDRAAGFGDGISGGLTNRVRGALGTNNVVNQSSSAYQNSQVTGAVTSLVSGTWAVGTGSRAGIWFFGGMDGFSTGVGVVSDRNAQSVMDAALLGGQEWVTRRIGLGNDLGSRLLAAQFDGVFGGMRLLIDSSWGLRVNKEDPMRREPVYAGFMIVKGWICWAAIFPFLGGIALIFTTNDPLKDELVFPLWFGVIAYGATCVGQYVYFKYAPTAREAARISRKFVWWMRLIIVPMHCGILIAFFMDQYRPVPEMVVAALGGLAYFTIAPIWNRDLDKRIRLY